MEWIYNFSNHSLKIAKFPVSLHAQSVLVDSCCLQHILHTAPFH